MTHETRKRYESYTTKMYSTSLPRYMLQFVEYFVFLFFEKKGDMNNIDTENNI
jgi:hypothetical protein